MALETQPRVSNGPPTMGLGGGLGRAPALWFEVGTFVSRFQSVQFWLRAPGTGQS